MWNESEQERKEKRKVLDFLHRGRMMPSGKKRKSQSCQVLRDQRTFHSLCLLQGKKGLDCLFDRKI